MAVAKFSDMVGSGSGGGSSFGATSADSGNFKFGTVFKKVGQRRKSQISVEDHFKIRDKEPDGKLTVRKLNGLRRDSEIIFVPKKSSEDDVGEGLDNFDGRGVGLGRLGGDTHLGIFDRPGLYFLNPSFTDFDSITSFVTTVFATRATWLFEQAGNVPNRSFRAKKTLHTRLCCSQKEQTA